MRLTEAFRGARGGKSAALIPFFTGGFPRLDSTVPLLRAAAANGADVVEVGVPFSDPMADGAAIARAGEAALKNGATLRGILRQVAEFRGEDSQTPVVLMGYANSFMNFGVEEFSAAAGEAGADGLIVVDLADEERAAWQKPLLAAGVALVPLVAPTTTEARAAKLAAAGEGFVYFISLRGVTGAAHLDAAALAGDIGRLRGQTSLPVAVGFGVRTAAQAAAVAAAGADGVVIGSRLTEIVSAAAAAGEDAAAAAAAFLAEVGAALTEKEAGGGGGGGGLR